MTTSTSSSSKDKQNSYPTKEYRPVPLADPHHPEIVIYLNKVWRSELERVMLFCISLVSSVGLTWRFPQSVIVGDLFTIGNTTAYLYLPIFWLIPLSIFLESVVRIYNVLFRIDRNGIKAWHGIVSLNQKITNIRFEDIRGVELRQNIWERMMDVGTIEIGTSASKTVDLIIDGIEAPYEVQVLILNERDRRIKERSEEGTEPAEDKKDDNKQIKTEQ